MTLFIIAWLACGVVLWLVATFMDWRQGMNITLEHLYYFIPTVLFCPMMLVVLIFECLKEPNVKVIIRGRKKGEK